MPGWIHLKVQLWKRASKTWALWQASHRCGTALLSPYTRVFTRNLHTINKLLLLDLEPSLPAAIRVLCFPWTTRAPVTLAHLQAALLRSAPQRRSKHNRHDWPQNEHFASRHLQKPINSQPRCCSHSAHTQTHDKKQTYSHRWCISPP